MSTSWFGEGSSGVARCTPGHRVSQLDAQSDVGKPYSEVAIGDFASSSRRCDLVRGRPDGGLDGVLFELDRHGDGIGM